MAARAKKRERLGVDERRAQLVALGLERFGARPYDEVSLDEIAEAAGISKGLVYHYFPTKKDYYAATVVEGARRLLEMTDVPPDAPASEVLARGLDAYLRYVEAHGPAYAALLRSGVGVDPAIARVVEDTRATFIARLTAGLGASGFVAANEAAARVAMRGYIGLVEAACLDWLDHGGVTREALAALLARALGDLTRAAADCPVER
jgi:AcrR family transcriptional regulator